MRTRKLIALVADVAALRLGDTETRDAIGDHHRIPLPNGDCIIVSYPKNWVRGRNLLSSRGATVLPLLSDPATAVGADAAARFPGGIVATDISFTAAKKLYAHLGHPFLDPEE